MPILPKRLFAAIRRARPAIQVSPLLVEVARADAAAACERLETTPAGLTDEQAAERLARFGPNVLARDQRTGFAKLLLHAVVNPLVLLMSALALVSFLTEDARAGFVMLLMIVLGVVLKLVQEAKADAAAARLKAMISVTTTVVRSGREVEVPVSEVVPGDVVRLGAGDMVPADVRLLAAKDLFVAQSSLTGESLPVEKFEAERTGGAGLPIEFTNVAFLGTNVESGSASALVVATGRSTYLGGMAEKLAEPPPPTAFDKGISRFTWLMLRFMGLMVPLVFVINGWTKGVWADAFFFALAVAVGLTPEMLPMIVTVCLSKGAIAMSRKKVIVKRINAIQNLGAMDVLCTDKTGTLTMDRVILERHCDVVLREDPGVLQLAFLNSHFQTGLRNVLDRAVLLHQETCADARVLDHRKVDEIPFDFQRRVMSVVVRTPEGRDRIITKGAPEAVFERCRRFELDGELFPMAHVLIEDLKEEYQDLSRNGFRVLAIASKEVEPREVSGKARSPYGRGDECDLVLNGYLAFLDPPKESARAAIEAMHQHGIAVKVVTGDNDLVARKICSEVGLPTDHVLLGAEVERLDDEALAERAEQATLFARVSPAHKERIIRALQARKHTVGFMGDGINDAPALRAADVGISVDTAVDIAKESADMILLERSLLVLEQGVLEGRKVFANILKYIRMGASSNFGNMFSVLGASLFVPFLPMAPIQILANNLLYDVGQTAIPTDEVDPEQIARPRPWDMGQLTRFILCIGPCSSLFDYTTYFLMLYVFGCRDVSTPERAAASESLFQTGWFLESLLTQTLIIHVIRTRKVPFLQSRPSWPLMAMSACIVAVGVAIPFTPLGRSLGFVPPPRAYWAFLAATLACYVVLTQFVKAWLSRRRWI
jgi:Mg2+-importing ATPase